MTLNELASELAAKVLQGAEAQLAAEVRIGASGDLMSDMLARMGTPDVMLTGLNTTQVIRTCSVAGIKAVVIARGKGVGPTMIDLAREEDIVLMATRMSLFEASGRLWARGVRSSAPAV
jgi:hypothetical protein